MIGYFRKTIDSKERAYRIARGDVTLSDVLFTPESFAKGYDMLAKMGAGELAYTDYELRGEFEQIISRRFSHYDGGNTFNTPNYAIEDPEIAAFYGVKAIEHTNVPSTRNMSDIVDEILRESAKEALAHVPGILQVKENFNTEEWMRLGVDSHYTHEDPDITLFRNKKRDFWTSVDNPLSTNDKRNTIVLYDQRFNDGYSDNVHTTPHPGFMIDRR